MPTHKTAGHRPRWVKPSLPGLQPRFFGSVRFLQDFPAKKPLEITVLPDELVQWL